MNAVPEWQQIRCSVHTARKAHAHPCEHCGQPIGPGERYHALVGLYGGALLSTRFHVACPSWEAHWDEEHPSAKRAWSEASHFAWEDRA